MPMATAFTRTSSRSPAAAWKSWPGRGSRRGLIELRLNQRSAHGYRPSAGALAESWKLSAESQKGIAIMQTDTQTLMPEAPLATPSVITVTEAAAGKIREL